MGRASSSEKKQGPTEPQHDPAILAEFERETVTRPPDEARIALNIVRACVAGDRAQLDVFFDKQAGAYRDITVGHLQTVVRVVKKVFGDWTH